MAWRALIDWLLSFLYRMPKPAPEPAPLPTPEPPKQPSETTSPPAPVPEPLSWFTPAGAFKLTRMMCDTKGLTYEQKDIVCACLFQESRFNNDAVCINRENGKEWSRDIGIVQVNTYFHCGPKKRFPSTEYVLAHPEAAVAWMVDTMKQTGALQPWVSYTSDAYKFWLPPTSPMWLLKK